MINLVQDIGLAKTGKQKEEIMYGKKVMKKNKKKKKKKKGKK